jgi:hypothetical protein
LTSLPDQQKTEPEADTGMRRGSQRFRSEFSRDEFGFRFEMAGEILVERENFSASFIPVNDSRN